MRNKKSFIITIIILVTVAVFARYQNNQVAAQAYQNHKADQGIKAFKVNKASKI
jgi:hypothetical protein